MRSLLIGSIGAVAATAAWLAIEHFTQSNLSWLSCLVGLATGLGVRWAADAEASGAVKRGALSVALTLIAILLGPQVYVKVMEVALPTTDAIVTEVNNFEPANEQSAPQEQEQEENTPETVVVENEPQEQGKPELTVEEEEPQEQDQVAETSPESPEEPAESTASPKTTPSTQPKSHYRQWDMLWMCLAALAAYVTGKNSGTTSAAVSAGDANDTALSE